MTPTALYDLAELVRSCVCDQMDALALEMDGYPGCSCLTYVSAGEPAVDCCTTECDEGGMLTVHVESAFPSDVFPARADSFDPCRASTWVAGIVVTASRCAPTVNEQGNMPSADELSDSARLMAIDQHAVLTALSCCLVAEPVAGKRRRRVQISDSRPLVSDGGCASTEIRVLVEVGRLCACPDVVS